MADSASASSTKRKAEGEPRKKAKARKADEKPSLPAAPELVMDPSGVLSYATTFETVPPAIKKANKGAPPDENTTCLLCSATLKLKDMRQHVGAHMALEGFNTIRCGFCGLDDGTCEISLTAGTSTVTVTPVPQGHCPRFRKFYVTSAQKNHKCTNIPMQCSACSQWLWKYTLPQHYRECHDGEATMSAADRDATALSQAELDGLQKLASDLATKKRKPRAAPAEPEPTTSDNWIDAFVPLEVEPNVFLV
ncbi:hypothetical protein ACHHYP_04854 [Achlya hypogyna]|uniref:Uncharacterized protein n=1 Tax=Achlya hypogyna TaxID=1202772 RepID=A0A1V9Z014_ACHHY|nr:hypothetical protein ACHHYP_04854 [Achlya hypogyna]